MLDAVPVSVFLITKDYRIQVCNSWAQKRIGIPANDSMNYCYEKIYKRSHPCPYCPALEEGFFKSTVIEKDIQEKISLGEQQNYRLRFLPGNSDEILLIETIEDTTERNIEQEDLLLRENLAALGIMVSGIAHELNNPLTGIGLTLQNLISNVDSYNRDEILEKLKIIRKDMMKASRIVSDILSFANPERLRLSRTNFCKIVQKASITTRRLHPVLSKKISWIIEQKDIMVDIDVEKIERLFINLFRNSIHAFDYSAGYIEIKFESTGKFLRVLIEDNAGGIKKENLSKIFQPFYSESNNKHSSGLGLSICHSIVKEHNGNIHVRSIHEKTRFYISLPIKQISRYE